MGEDGGIRGLAILTKAIDQMPIQGRGLTIGDSRLKEAKTKEGTSRRPARKGKMEGEKKVARGGGSLYHTHQKSGAHDAWPEKVAPNPLRARLASKQEKDAY